LSDVAGTKLKVKSCTAYKKDNVFSEKLTGWKP
jgi:hypothetical protein